MKLNLWFTTVIRAYSHARNRIRERIYLQGPKIRIELEGVSNYRGSFMEKLLKEIDMTLDLSQL